MRIAINDKETIRIKMIPHLHKQGLTITEISQIVHKKKEFVEAYLRSCAFKEQFKDDL